MNGSLAEWLGTGLQNRLRRFESARNLKSLILTNGAFFLFTSISITYISNYGVLHEKNVARS